MNQKMELYAQLLLEKGINIQEGEPLLIVGPAERMDFIHLLTRKAYAMGITDIDYILEDEILKHEAYLHLSLDQLKLCSLFDRSKLKTLSEKGGSAIFLEGNDPDLMQDVEAEKIALTKKIGLESQGDAYDKRSKYIMPWVIAAVPTVAWAEKIFDSHEDPESNVEKLWAQIFKCSYVDDNPMQSWDKKDQKDKERTKKLTELRFKKLHYQNDLGTDFTVELNQGTVWEGASTFSPSKQRKLLVNIPTEEVFTSPKYDSTNGTVCSSKPLVYNGSIIEGIRLVFKNGKVEEVHADKGQSILESILHTDAYSSYLGEIALVEYDSPISKSGILFYTTLYDENAACHLALGNGFPLCIEGGENMDKKDLLAAGVNTSDIHVDFMIGTKDLSITGETFDGKEYTIFENGNFKIEELH